MLKMPYPNNFTRLQEQYQEAKTAQQDRETEVIEKAQLTVSKIKERLEWVETEQDLETRQNMVEDLDYLFGRILEELERF
jgi:hypothetical protein